jgi:MGT family glycosyltransferase
MARILMATVPMSGHVNPGTLLARALIQKGHIVSWYCSDYYKERIIATGASFEPFKSAPNYNDRNIHQLYGPVPNKSLLAHAGFYVRNVFYKAMPAYYDDLTHIVHDFKPHLLITDEWFTGGIPFSEKKILPLVIFSNSPLMLIRKNLPAPGAGVMPNNSQYGKVRDLIIFIIAKILLDPWRRYINKVRKEVGLQPMRYYFIEQNIRFSSLTLKFNTPIFEYKYIDLPSQIHFVGPVLPETKTEKEFRWLKGLKSINKPIIFITQGSVDAFDINKLIVPSIIALQNENVQIIISVFEKSPGEIYSRFNNSSIIIEEFIPYRQIMPYIDILITNGGYGGVITALSFGVPIIVSGNSEEKPDIARRVAYCGAGINLKTGNPTPQMIQKAVKKVLLSPDYRMNAQKVQRDFNKHDAISESVCLIEDFLIKSAGKKI